MRSKSRPPRRSSRADRGRPRRAAGVSPARRSIASRVTRASISPASSTDMARAPSSSSSPDRGGGAQVRAALVARTRLLDGRGDVGRRRGGEPHVLGGEAARAADRPAPARRSRAAGCRAAPRSADWIPKLSRPPAATSGDPEAPATTGSPESSAAWRPGAAGARRISSHSAMSREPSACRDAARLEPAVFDAGGWSRGGAPSSPASRSQTWPASRRASRPRGRLGQLQQELRLGALAVALERAGTRRRQPRRAAAASVQLGRGVRRRRARSRACRRPGRRSAARSAPSSSRGRRQARAGCARRPARRRSRPARASSSTATATGIRVQRDARATRRPRRRSPAGCPRQGDHRLARCVVEPRDHAVGLDRLPHRRAQAADPLAGLLPRSSSLVHRSARHGLPRARSRRSYLHPSARGAPARPVFALWMRREPSGGRAVAALVAAGGSPPRYSGRFLMPSRVDHFE